MTAFILYDNFALAVRANRLLKRASMNADCSLDWSVMACRVEKLKNRVLANLALKEAADAHLIICAWLDSRPFHHWAESWFEQWNANRKVSEAAIAVLGETDDCGLRATDAELARFTQKHGISLIAGAAGAPVPTGPEHSNLAPQPARIQY